MKNKRSNGMLSNVGGVIGLSVGAAVNDSVNAPAAIKANTGQFFTGASSLMPAMGTLQGARMVLGATKKLVPLKRRY